MARSRDSVAQRERLSAATWTVLARDGATGLTLRAVAAEAGCTTGLVLHTFPDKQALLLHARDLLHERGRERADILDDGKRSPADVLTRFLMQSVALNEEGQSEARIWLGFLAAALGDEVLAERHRSGNHAFLDRTISLIDRAVPGLTDSEKTRRAITLSATVEGLNVLSTADPDYYTADAQQAALSDALRVALAPRP
ncbi:MAG: TetR/AcrR family transcriptional regulator [Mycetocola sp.]